MNVMHKVVRNDDLANNHGDPMDLPELTPMQASAYAKLERMLQIVPVAGLIGTAGSGRSTILRTLASRHKGRVITAEDMARVTGGQPAESFEDAIGAEIIAALSENDLVVIDDLNYLAAPGSGASNRPGFFRTVLRRITMVAVASGKRLVLSGRPPESWQTPADQFGEQAAVVTMDAFRPEDFAAIAANILGTARAARIDFGLVFRYAAHLQGYQLRLAFSLLADTPEVTAEDVIACLDEYVMSSNTRVSEVENVSFAQLPGHEPILEALEASIVLPMENRVLAQKLGLKPKRGVLLFGPPGTGKTSIGRALAHRMKGKFFLIDGSFISEPPGTFFGRFQRVVAEAKENSPSVLFIDDADVLFKVEHIAGLSRYLLSLLDGLESETANNVCVMMTAMNVASIPEALLRSGRVELWLETKVPDEPTRARILARWLGSELPDASQVDFAALASITEGFTPADLRRLVGDAKAIYASDVVRDQKLRTAADYLQRAVDEIVATRNRMADSLGDQRLRLKGGKYPINHFAGECGW